MPTREAPVTVLEDSEPVAVMLSPEEFKCSGEQDRIRREAKTRLRQTMAAVQAEAAGQGLNEAELDRLWADENFRHAVLDTKVFISGLLSLSGKPFACLSWVLDKATAGRPQPDTGWKLCMPLIAALRHKP